MKNTQRVINVFSNDRKFTTSIVNQANSENQKSNIQTEYDIFPFIGNSDQMSTCDLVIYDLDLADGDQLKMAEDILHLKLTSKSKPIFLVGKRQNIELAMASPIVKPVVKRTVQKPVMPRQLKLLIDNVLGHTAKRSVHPVNTGMNRPTLFSGVFDRAKKQVSNHI